MLLQELKSVPQQISVPDAPLQVSNSCTKCETVQEAFSEMETEFQAQVSQLNSNVGLHFDRELVGLLKSLLQS